MNVSLKEGGHIRNLLSFAGLQGTPAPVANAQSAEVVDVLQSLVVKTKGKLPPPKKSPLIFCGFQDSKGGRRVS